MSEWCSYVTKIASLWYLICFICLFLTQTLVQTHRSVQSIVRLVGISLVCLVLWKNTNGIILLQPLCFQKSSVMCTINMNSLEKPLRQSENASIIKSLPDSCKESTGQMANNTWMKHRHCMQRSLSAEKSSTSICDRFVANDECRE